MGGISFVSCWKIIFAGFGSLLPAATGTDKVSLYLTTQKGERSQFDGSNCTWNGQLETPLFLEAT